MDRQTKKRLVQADCPGPVSYTHLDVYKRQLERQLMCFSSENREVAELMKNYAVPRQRCEKEAGILERFRKQELSLIHI